MRVAATAFNSSLFSPPNRPSSSFSSSSSSSNSNEQHHDDHHLLPRKPKNNTTLLHTHPLYTQTTQKNISLQFKEKVLCLEIMGVDSGKALSLNPSLHSATLSSIHSIISFLQSKGGIHQKDLPRLIGMCPKILTSDIKSELNPVFDFLSHDLKVPEQNFRRVINKCPRLLVSSVKDQLKPAHFYLQRLGFKDLEALAYQDPILLVSSVENTLIPKLDYLVGLGFSKKEAVEMVVRCPSLFTFSIGNNFMPKFDFFRREMGGTLPELRDFPQYFTFSLEKRIKPRHAEALKVGVKVPLPLLLKTPDEEFNDLLMRQGP